METQKIDTIDNWRLDNKEIIAAVIHKEVMANRIFQRKFNVLPGEVGVWINNGKVEKIVTENQVVASGVMDRLLSKFGAGQDMVLMMLDASERVLQFSMGINSSSLGEEELRLAKRQLEAYGKQELTEKEKKAGASEQFIYQSLIDSIDQKIEKSKNAEDNKKSEDEDPLDPGWLDRMLGKAKKGSTAGKTRNKKTVAEQEEKYKAFQEYLTTLARKKKERVPILTKDRESIVFQVRVVLSMVPEKSGEIYKLIKGTRFFAEAELIDLISKELEARVFAPEISKYTAEELRGNLNILARIHKQAEEELFSWLDVYGIQLSRISVNPAMTEDERFAMFHREVEALHKTEEYQHERKKLELQKRLDLRLMQEKFALMKEKAAAENKMEMAELANAALLSKKQRELKQEEIEVEIQKIKTNAALDAKKLEEELAFHGVERKWALDKEKMLTQLDAELKAKTVDTDLEIKKMQALAEEHRKNKQLKTEAEIALIEARRQTSKDEQGHVEKMLEIAANANALDPGALAEALRQETMRKALDQGEGTAEAYSQAEAQRYSKEAFTQGIRSAPSIGVASDRGRVFVQQGHMANPGLPGPAAGPVPGGQQVIPQQVPGQPVAGQPVAGMAPQVPGQPPVMPAAVPPAQPAAAMVECPHCKKQVAAGSAFCGLCGGKME